MGSGQGVQLSANKHQGIRCALAWMPEIAELSRQHNNCNMVAMPARFIAKELALEIIEKFSPPISKEEDIKQSR